MLAGKGMKVKLNEQRGLEKGEQTNKSSCQIKVKFVQEGHGGYPSSRQRSEPLESDLGTES